MSLCLRKTRNTVLKVIKEILQFLIFYNFFNRQPEFRKWAFNLPRGGQCLSKWNIIPDNTDILVTHTPPLGFGDLCCTGVRAGCVELLSTVQQRVLPKYHIFGHIHESNYIYILLITVFICDKCSITTSRKNT